MNFEPKSNYLLYMRHTQKLMIIDDTHEMSDIYQNIFAEDRQIQIVSSSSDSEELKKKLRYDFYIINIHCDEPKKELVELVSFIRGFLDQVKPYMLAITSERKRIAAMNILGLSLMPKPVNTDYLYNQTKNSLNMLAANRSIDDITHLPGNYVIDTTLRRKIEEQDKFVLIYLDIDKFKPYTDYYGVYKAGVLIKFVADLLTEAVNKYGCANDFVGHVGGDDFTLILNDFGYAKKIGQEVIRKFDESISSFYEPEDLERGYIEILNRKNKLERFKLISLSLAMVGNEHIHYTTTDEVYKHMMKVKEEAKQISGSVMLCDTSKL